MPKTLLLFDIDGTLIRTGGVAARALDRAVEELHGIAGGMSRFPWGGMTDPLIVRKIFALLRPEYSPTTAEILAILERYLEILTEAIVREPGYRILPGLPDLLEELATREDVVQGLATGNMEKSGRVKLRHGGLDRYFSFGGFASDAEIRADIVRIAIARGRAAAGEEIPLERTFVIGDTPHDVSAARAAGCRVIAVATGPHAADQLAEHEPDLLLESLSDRRRVFDFLGL